MSRVNNKLSLKLLAVCIGFILILSAKDLLFRIMAIQGLDATDILFLTGVGCFISSTLFSVILSSWGHRDVFAFGSLRVQLLRLVISGTSSLFIANAFKYLNATTVTMASKIYIPLMVIIAPLFGVFYNRKQRGIALFAICSILLFAFFDTTSLDKMTGFYFIGLAVFCVILEYILLRKATFISGLFWLSFIPSLSCILYGLLLSKNGICLLNEENLFMGLLSGFMLYLVYTASSLRYKLLPLGISEYPSLFTALVLLPVEIKYYQWNPNWIYLACLFVTIFLMILTLYFKNKNVISN